MEELVKLIVQTVLGGGVSGLSTMSLLLPAAMVWFVLKREAEIRAERRELIDRFQSEIERDRKDLMEVIESYQDGQISTNQALTGIRVLIAALGSKAI